MFYEMKRGRVGYITYAELQDDSVMYGFPEETIRACKENLHNFRSDTIVTGKLVFTVLDLINLLQVFDDKDRLAIYVQSDLCLFVEIRDDDGSIRQLFDRVVASYCGETKSNEIDLRHTVPEKFLYRFLDLLIQEDRKFLENMEFNMSALETRILKERVDAAFINEILLMKKELMYMWNYYDQLIDIGEVLRDNDNEMFPPENVRRFATFTERTMRLSENVKHLKEYAVQLRETHDAMLDYNLNNIMKLFTVITTIFLPLTLIVGWYGMNFVNMPELTWRYGYLGVIIFSVVVVGICIIAFKKYKLF
ncbi:MAG: CorA family divalent cation transporter [Lachnospiraceae bacterium]|nr:CorA family divalent cation transporter [Lachnospiraceae bacterium]